MKRFLAIVGLLAATPVSAQVVETYSFGVTQAQANRVDLYRVVINQQSCNAAGLALDCTEAQLQAVPGFESERVYPDSEQGRRDMILDKRLLGWFQTEILAAQKSWDTEKARLSWAGATRAEKDDICADFPPPIGPLPAGCELY